MTKNNSTPERDSNLESKDAAKQSFLARHPLLSTVLIALIVIAGVYGTLSIKNRRIRVKHTKEITAIKDSLSLDYRKDNVRIFSWAVRSEVNRGNLDQVESLFINYLQTDDIVRVVLVNPEDGSIVLSTNKKDNDTLVDDKEVVNASSIVVVDKGSTFYVVNPIMGLDRKTGILLVEINK